jgi:hypothetical protein
MKGPLLSNGQKDADMSSPILAALLLLALNGAQPPKPSDAAPEAVVVAAENPRPEADRLATQETLTRNPGPL